MAFPIACLLCEFVYDFWNSKRRGSGIEFDNLTTFRFAHGYNTQVGDEAWQVYSNLPRPINLALQAPTEDILKNLLATLNELPKVAYQRTFPFAKGHLDCDYTIVHGGTNVGNSQHDYSIYYPELKQFGRLLSRGNKFRRRTNKQAVKAGQKMFGKKLGYALTKTISHRFPMHLEQVMLLVDQGYLAECSDGLRLLTGDCDGGFFPTVRRSKSGEQIEVWYSADERKLFAWNPSVAKLETEELLALSGALRRKLVSAKNFYVSSYRAIWSV